MRHKKLKLSTILLLVLYLTPLQAQTAIPASGGNATGSGGKIAYSMGQLVCTTNTGTTGSLVQGVQQSFEIYIVTEIKEAKEINLIISSYPNPVNDFIKLIIENYNLVHLSYQLCDVSGKLLESSVITNNQTSILMSNRIRATYLLKVIQDNKEIKTFKIIKN